MLLSTFSNDKFSPGDKGVKTCRAISCSTRFSNRPQKKSFVLQAHSFQISLLVLSRPPSKTEFLLQSFIKSLSEDYSSGTKSDKLIPLLETLNVKTGT